MSDTQTSRKASNKSSTASVAGGRKLGHKPLTFNTYIHKTLKNIHPKANLKKVAGMQLDVFIKCFAGRLASMAIRIANDAGRHTVGLEDIETAVQLMFPPDLCKAVMDAGDKAIDAFENSTSDEGKERPKKLTKASRSGLQFPPHISEKFLRQQNSTTQPAASRLSVAQRAPVYMAAVIEQLASILLTGGGDLALEDKRQTITVRHMFLATANDEELSQLMESLNLTWLGGGVTPFIHDALIPSKEKQRKLAQKRRRARKEKEGVTPTPAAARKALPGTKALRDIRRYQKTTGLLQRKEHFKRFVKEQAEELWGDEKIHYGAGVIEYLQLYIEDQASQVFRKSVDAMVHAGHETVDSRDIEFVWDFMRPSGVVNPTEVGVENLAVPGLRRLASRGGVKRISHECYPVIRDIMAFYVSRLLQATFLLMQRQHVKTITLPLLRRGAGMVGVNLPIDVVRRRRRRQTRSEDGEDGEEEEEEEEDDDVPIPIEEIPDTDTEGDGETPIDDESDDEGDDESDDEDSVDE